jgi:hypothetical protein
MSIPAIAGGQDVKIIAYANTRAEEMRLFCKLVYAR